VTSPPRAATSKTRTDQDKAGYRLAAAVEHSLGHQQPHNDAGQPRHKAGTRGRREENPAVDARDNRAELQLIIDGKVLVKVEANADAKSDGMAKDFAGRLGLKKVKELAK
jgi:hypothetical protein